MGFYDFCYMIEDVDHFLLQCIDVQEHWEVLVTALFCKSMIVSVVNVLQNECFFDLVWKYVTGKGL